MTEEEKIKKELEEKFTYLKDLVIIKRAGRIFIEVPLDKFDNVFNYAVKELRFLFLSTITGLDQGQAFEVIYHLNKENKIILTLSVKLAKQNPHVKTVTDYFPGADIYEREMVDLLGIEVDGLASGQRYPLPDNWPKDDHPLRKDWKKPTSCLPAGREAKNA